MAPVTCATVISPSPTARHVHGVELELRDHVVERDAVDRKVLELALDELLPLLAVLVFVLFTKPRAHLAAVALGGEYPSDGTSQSRLGSSCLPVMIST